MICSSCGGDPYNKHKFWLRLLGCSKCYGNGFVRPYNIDELFKANEYVETKDKIIVSIDDKRDIVTLENAGYEYISTSDIRFGTAYMTFKKPKIKVRMKKNVSTTK